FDLLQALNTGHLGSLTTIHANSAAQALTRLAHCILTAHVGLPHRSTREAIAQAIHLVVHLARTNGSRRVAEIVAIRGYDASTDRFLLDSRTGATAPRTDGSTACPPHPAHGPTGCPDDSRPSAHRPRCAAPGASRGRSAGWLRHRVPDVLRHRPVVE